MRGGWDRTRELGLALTFALAIGCGGEPSPSPDEQPKPTTPRPSETSEAPAIEFVEEPLPVRELAPLKMRACEPGTVDITGTCRMATKATIDAIDACARGVSVSCVEAGHRLNMGDGAASNVQAADASFTRACDAGDVQGCFWRGFFLVHGKAGNKNEEQGRALIYRGKWPAEQDCGSGKAGACRVLSLMLGGRYGIPKDAVAAKKARLEARNLWQEACDAGDGRACMQATRTYLSPEGTDEVSTALVRKACDLRDDGGCLEVAKSIASGKSGYAKDPADARNRFAALCDAGSPAACRRLSKMYESGSGGPANPDKAKVARARACDAGLTALCGGQDPQP